MNIFKNDRGITLIELILTLGVLGILLILIYSVNLFGIQTFSKGDKQSVVQNEIREASAFITKEIRIATEISLTTMPSTFDPLFHYIYIKDSYMKHTYNNVTKNITSNMITELIPMFQLEKLNNKKNMLVFELKSSLAGNSFDLKSEILLNNKSDVPSATNQVIKYKKPT